MDSFVTSVALIGIVIVVASLMSGAIERSGFPLVAIFLLIGVAIGPWGFGIADVGFHSPALHALAMLGLALLLFSDAVTLDTGQLRARKRMLWRLIGPGTLVPATITALTAWLLLGLSGPAAAILGAALASTDPVLLRTVLRSKALPDAPRLALRLETGMNDVVLLPIVIISMLLLPGGHINVSTTATSGTNLGRSLLGLFVLGPALGALVGWVGISALAAVRSRTGLRRDYESLYALGLAFTSFATAEAVGGSGRVIVQTLHPEHYAIQAVRQLERRLFYEPELQFRAELGYPPYRRLCLLDVRGKTEEGARALIAECTAALSGIPGIRVYAPTPRGTPAARRPWWRILVKGPADLPRLLEEPLRPLLERRRRSPGVVNIEIDPISL